MGVLEVIGWILAVVGAINVGLGFAFSNMVNLIGGIVVACVGIIFVESKKLKKQE